MSAALSASIVTHAPDVALLGQTLDSLRGALHLAHTRGMLVHTDVDESRWNVVESDDKRRSRVNMIAHLLSQIPYTQVAAPALQLPKRPPSRGYVRTARSLQHTVPDHAASLEP